MNTTNLTAIIGDYSASDNQTKQTRGIITIYFDGGCSPNPGNKYGSYEVLLDGYPICKAARIEFGHGTNNEAEFNALTAALKDLARWASVTGFDLSSVAAYIETDSMIVRNRLSGQNKVHKKSAWRHASERMFKLAQEAIEYGTMFESFKVSWKPRENNVQRFGH